MRETKTIYFNEAGPENTESVLNCALERARELNIRHVVVASTSGETALKALEILSPVECALICVAEHCGFAGSDKQLLIRENREKLERAGVQVFIGSHALSGVGRSLSKKFGGITPAEVIAASLRLMGCEGVKVAAEIAVMAADAGMIPTDREVVCIAGTGKGADTAVVLKAAHMNNFFDLEIREIIAKPRQRKD